MSKEEFWEAIKCGNVPGIKAILETNPDYANEHYENNLPLGYAALSGHIEIMDALIEAGAHLNGIDYHDMTALHHAYRRGSLEVVRFLLAAGSSMDIDLRPGFMTMDLVYKTCSLDIISITLLYKYHPHALFLGSLDNDHPQLARALEEARPYAEDSLTQWTDYRMIGVEWDTTIEEAYGVEVSKYRGDFTKAALRAPVSQFVYDDTTEEESADVMDVADATEVVVVASQVLPAAEAGEVAEAAPRTVIDYGAAHGALLGDLTIDWDTLGLEM